MAQRGHLVAGPVSGEEREAGPGEGGVSLRRTRGETILNWSGFLIGMFVMLGDYLASFAFPGRAPIASRQWEFLRAPQSQVWILLVSAQFAFWANVIFPLRRARASIDRSFGAPHRPDVYLKAVAAIVFFALPAFFFSRGTPDWGLAHHDAKLGIVNAVGAFVAIAAAAGIWDIRATIEARFAGPGPGEQGGRTPREWAADILRLRQGLQRFIGLLGAMVGLGTLTKGALRQAFLATGGVPNRFPPEYILIHGAYYSALLALVYMPTHALLAEVGDRLIDAVFPIVSPELDLKKSAGWQADRKALEDLLQTGTKATDNLRASLSILAPLATSLVSVWLGTKDLAAR